MAKLESQKKELFFGLNDFDKPAYATGIAAWMSLIRQLLYTEKGSYPSCPDLGVGLQSYEFEFMDAAIRKIKDEILSQIHTYLPDIPIASVTLQERSFPDRADPILLIIFVFLVDGNYVSSAIAIDKQNRIDFEVSM